MQVSNKPSLPKSPIRVIGICLDRLCTGLGSYTIITRPYNSATLQNHDPTITQPYNIATLQKRAYDKFANNNIFVVFFIYLKKDKFTIFILSFIYYFLILLAFSNILISSFKYKFLYKNNFMYCYRNYFK